MKLFNKLVSMVWKAIPEFVLKFLYKIIPDFVTDMDDMVYDYELCLECDGSGEMYYFDGVYSQCIYCDGIGVHNNE